MSQLTGLRVAMDSVHTDATREVTATCVNKIVVWPSRKRGEMHLNPAARPLWKDHDRPDGRSWSNGIGATVGTMSRLCLWLPSMTCRGLPSRLAMLQAVDWAARRLCDHPKATTSPRQTDSSFAGRPNHPIPRSEHIVLNRSANASSRAPQVCGLKARNAS